MRGRPATTQDGASPAPTGSIGPNSSPFLDIRARSCPGMGALAAPRAPLPVRTGSRAAVGAAGLARLVHGDRGEVRETLAEPAPQPGTQPLGGGILEARHVVERAV